MITLRVQNTSTFIDNAHLLDERHKKAIRNCIGFKDEAAFFRARNIPGYDGVITCLCFGYGKTPCRCAIKKSGMHFPSGLLGKVMGLFEMLKVEHRVVDDRSKVERVANWDVNPETCQPRDYQIEITDKAIKWGRGIVKLATGGGKCQQESDVCLTSDGMLTMGELGSGLDPQEYRPLVKGVASPLTRDRRETTSEVYRDGIGQSRRYTTRYGFTSAATPQHRIKVLSAEGEIEWKYVRDLQEEDVAVVCKGQGLFGVNESLTEEDAYWWGLVYGDGGCTSQYQLKFTNSDGHLLSFAKAYLEEREISFIDREHRTSSITREIEIGNRAYRTSLAGQGMAYAKSIEKCVPRVVRESPKSQVASFVRGLYETDGWIGREAGKPCICIGLSSKTFIDQLHVILLNFGIVASRRLKPTTHEDSHVLTIYRDYIPTFMSEIGLDPNGHKHAKLVEAMREVEGVSQNSNTDVIPNQSAKLRRLRSIIKSMYGYYGTKGLVEQSGIKWATFRSWADACAWREPTRRSLRRLLEWAKSLFEGAASDGRVENVDESKRCEALSLVRGMLWLCDEQFFFDRIESVEETVTDNYDFVVPETHSFVAQGFVNHNTGTAARLIAKLGAFPFVFFVPSKDLLKQAASEFEKFILCDGKPITVGQVGNGKRTIGDITVMTVHTAIRALCPDRFETVGKDGKKKKSKKKVKLIDDEDGDVGDEDDDLGEFYGEVRELLWRCKGFICDEVQHWASETCQVVSDYCQQARYRYGFSATPWRDKGDDMLIDACFGKAICDINASFLIDRGFLIQPTIFFVPIQNMKDRSFDSYADAYEKGIVQNELRNTWIANIAKKLSDEGRMILILVKNIAHGELLEQAIPGSVFIHGSHSGKVREDHIEAMKEHKAPITIASTIFDEGIDVRPLDGVILAGGGKSQTRALQRIGRAIRPYSHSGYVKENAVIIDFYDDMKWMKQHAQARRRIYETEPRFTIKKLQVSN